MTAEVADAMSFLVFLVCFVGATFALSWIPLALEAYFKRREPK